MSESGDFRQDIILLPGEELEEAVVSAAIHGRAGQHVIPMNEIISAPVVFSEPDVLKALQSLPGVQSGMDGTAGIIVRGGGPDENLFLLDGIPIYNVSHMLGLFSAFSPEAINNIQDIYRIIYQKGLNVSHAVELIKEQYGNTDEGKIVLSFIGSANTGLMKGYTYLSKGHDPEA